MIFSALFSIQTIASVGGKSDKLPHYDFTNFITSGGSQALAFGAKTGKGGINIIDPYTNNEREIWAGTIDGEVDGNSVLFYCIDISHNLATSSEGNVQYYTDDGSTSDEITYILNNYYPFVEFPYSGAMESKEKEAASIQLAIWHFADELNAEEIDNEELRIRTTEIIFDAEENASLVTYPNTLEIVPTSQTIPSGQAAQFVIYVKDNFGNPLENVEVSLSNTSGTLSDSLVVTDETGEASFSLLKGNDNYAEVSATAAVTIPQGTKYVHVAEPDEYQKIVLATPAEGNLSRTADVTWNFPEDDCDGDGDNSISIFGGYKFEFISTVNNGDGSQTWTYKVKGLGAEKDLSYWILALCEDHNVLNASYDGMWEVGTDFHTNIFGIKWEKLIDKNGIAKTFSFTLDGIYDTTIVDVAFKAGYESYYCTILGPSCDEVENCEQSIGDFIWHDKNVNGIQDEGESGIEGVTVELFDGTNVTTTITDENGYYEFSGLQNGEYSIKVAESNYQAGGIFESSDQIKWYASPKNQGDDDAKDSDAGKNESVTVNLNCCDNYTIDFGFYKTCVSLIKEGPETAEPGDEITYTFKIENCGDVKLVGGFDLYDELLNPNGDHKIDHRTPLLPGNIEIIEKTYTVTEDDCGELTNHAWVIGHPEDGSPSVRYDDYWTTQINCEPECNGEIGDRVWLDYTPDKPDYNCNGIQDDEEFIGENGEPGIVNVKIVLKNSAGQPIDSTFTNENGNYLFGELCAGTYHVEVDESTIPENYSPAPTNQGSDNSVDSDENGVEVVLLNNDSKDYTIDFGYCMPVEEPEVDIEVIKSTMATNLEDGDQFSYIITVTNNGPDNATGVEIADELPQGIVYISHSASAGTYNKNNGQWLIGNLASGESETLEITVLVDVELINNSTIDLGPAAEFNLFVINDAVQPSSDTEGKVAVGRNANFSNYSIGNSLPPNSGDVLVVGKDLTFISGAVYNGNVVYGNNTNLIGNIAVSITGGTLRKDYPIDFPAAESYLKNLSTTLFNYSTNGTTTLLWGGLILEGSDPLLNVFDVNGADLSSANNFQIIVPNGSVVLVNINGDDINWSGGLTVSGTSLGNVLYNFKQAANLTIQGIDVRGSILAPKAHVNFVSGVQNGQMICKSLEGIGQFNNSLFIGNIPVETEIVNIASLTNVNETDTNEENNSDDATVVVNAPDNGGGDGSDWEYVGSFLEGQIVWSLTFTDDGGLLVGTMGGMIYKSAPGGIEFTRINENMNVGFIWSLLVLNGDYYAGTEKGLWEYDGLTWTQVGLTGLDVRSLASADGKLFAAVWGQGIYVSEDNGSTWSLIESDVITNKAIQDIAVRADGNLQIYAATLGSGVYYSPDGGGSWSTLNVGYNFIWSIASTSEGTLFAGTYGDGLYKSDDGGSIWNKVIEVTAGYVYDINIDSEDNVYISTLFGGVYVSTNAGDSFSNDGLGGYGVSSILASSNSESRTIYAGTSSGSIYRKISENGVTSINDEETPKEYKLAQNYPNPFNPSTTIQFAVPEAGEYKVVVYNILGQQVAELLNNYLQPGEYNVQFNTNNLSSGIYIYRLRGNKVNYTKKMILMK